MAIKRLTAPEMIQLSAPWTNANDAAGAAIAKVPLLAGLLPQLKAAHQAIFAAQVATEDPRTKALSQAEAELDGTHDSLARGIYVSLTVLSEFSASGEELLRLRDLLFPEGLEHTQKTYRGEAGHAAIVASRLDDGVKARIKSVSLHDKNLLDLVSAWLEAARKLGELEEERARLTAPAATSAAQLNDARLAWIRVANALLANAELAGIDDDTNRTLFAALRAAGRTADARKRSSKQNPNPVEPPANPVGTGNAAQ